MTGKKDGKSFYGWETDDSNDTFVTKRFEVTTELLPESGSTKTFTATWSSGDTYTINYYLQDENGNYGEPDPRFSQTAIGSKNFSPKEIFGYTYDRRTDNNRTNNLYYKRNSYSIEYKNADGSNIETKNALFEKNINTSEYNFTPTRPEGIDNEAVFDGWYDNPGCIGEPYTFGKMPANNIVLYPKWTVPEKTVTVELGEGVVLPSGETTFTVVKGQPLSSAEAMKAAPIKEGYDFVGWSTSLIANYDPVTGEANLINIDDPVTNDITIYPVWKASSTVNYTVYHKTADGTNIVDPVTGSGQVGTPVQVTALPEDKLTGDFAGLIPDFGVQTVDLVAGKNDITFTYAKLGDIKYTVRYVMERHGAGGGRRRVRRRRQDPGGRHQRVWRGVGEEQRL